MKAREFLVRQFDKVRTTLMARRRRKRKRSLLAFFMLVLRPLRSVLADRRHGRNRVVAGAAGERARVRLPGDYGLDPHLQIGRGCGCEEAAEERKPMRLIHQSVAKNDPDPKAISCYGLYVPEFEETWIRFVDGRPVSSITTRLLLWCIEKLQAAGKKILFLIWGNASWHVSKEVRRWPGRHNRRVKGSGEGVRIVSLLPKQSPWLNAIEPKWVHGKRKIVETDGLLSTYELSDRVCRVFDYPHYEHLSITQEVS